MADFPTTLWNGFDLNCSSLMDDPVTGGPAVINGMSDEIEALEAKVGVNGSTDVNSLDYKINHLPSLSTSTYSGVAYNETTNKLIDETTYAELGTWVEYKNVTATYTATGALTGFYTMAINADVTARLYAGVKLRITQGTIKHFVCMAETYSSPNTAITLFGGSDFTLTADPITKVEYSYAKAPFGFSLDKTKWSYNVPAIANYAKATPVSGTGYTSASFDLPLGCWNAIFHTYVYVVTGAPYSAVAPQLNIAWVIMNNASGFGDYFGLYDTMFIKSFYTTQADTTARMWNSYTKNVYLTQAATTTWYSKVSGSWNGVTGTSLETAFQTVTLYCAYI
jgi:hypothetical protein